MSETFCASFLVSQTHLTFTQDLVWYVYRIPRIRYFSLLVIWSRLTDYMQTSFLQAGAALLLDLCFRQDSQVPLLFKEKCGQLAWSNYACAVATYVSRFQNTAVIASVAHKTDTSGHVVNPRGPDDSNSIVAPS